MQPKFSFELSLHMIVVFNIFPPLEKTLKVTINADKQQTATQQTFGLNINQMQGKLVGSIPFSALPSPWGTRVCGGAAWGGRWIDLSVTPCPEEGGREAVRAAEGESSEAAAMS